MKMILSYKSVSYLNEHVLTLVFGVAAGIILVRLGHICIKAINESDDKFPWRQFTNHIIALIICAILYNGFVDLIKSYF